MKELMISQISNRQGTEAVMRGIMNEDCVLSASVGMEWVKAVREVGSLSKREKTYLAASPEAAATIDLSAVQRVKG